MTQFENLYISSHGEARNIKLVQQVNLIQRVQLGTPHQEVVTSLPHNHVTLTNLLYLQLQRLLLSNLCSKNNLIKSIEHFSIGQDFPNSIKRWGESLHWGVDQKFCWGKFFSLDGGGEDCTRNTFNLLRLSRLFNAQINIPYILNIS